MSVIGDTKFIPTEAKSTKVDRATALERLARINDKMRTPNSGGTSTPGPSKPTRRRN